MQSHWGLGFQHEFAGDTSTQSIVTRDREPSGSWNNGTGSAWVPSWSSGEQMWPQLSFHCPWAHTCVQSQLLTWGREGLVTTLPAQLPTCFSSPFRGEHWSPDKSRSFPGSPQPVCVFSPITWKSAGVTSPLSGRMWGVLPILPSPASCLVIGWVWWLSPVTFVRASKNAWYLRK
jgi:hypothetical protein